MIIALTGTPGTGKTSISRFLNEKEIDVIDLNKTAIENNFISGNDEIRNSKIVDLKKIDEYLNKEYKNKNLTIIEGHLSHLLICIDKVILLRCHPEKLKENLNKKGWGDKKIKENIEAEILDIILCEAIELHSKENIIEIDVTNMKIDKTASLIAEIINNKFKNIKKYKIGKIDWSEEILKDF
jgi:adenylate kinase